MTKQKTKVSTSIPIPELHDVEKWRVECAYALAYLQVSIEGLAAAMELQRLKKRLRLVLKR